LIDSRKFDKHEYFTVARENQWKPTSTDPDQAKKQTFLASLVYFNELVR